MPRGVALEMVFPTSSVSAVVLLTREYWRRTATSVRVDGFLMTEKIFGGREGLFAAHNVTGSFIMGFYVAPRFSG